MIFKLKSVHHTFKKCQRSVKQMFTLLFENFDSITKNVRDIYKMFTC